MCYTILPSVAGGSNPAARGENRDYMKSNKQTIKLYWVTAQDHNQDWFIFAESAKSARAYHEEYEGYNKGEAQSRLIVSNVTLKEFMNGEPPCNAQFQDLYQIGFQDAGTVQHRDMARLNGEIFLDGIFEAIIGLGRKQLELVPKNSVYSLTRPHVQR
jgi:hypothetical protein